MKKKIAILALSGMLVSSLGVVGFAEDRMVHTSSNAQVATDSNAYDEDGELLDGNVFDDVSVIATDSDAEELVDGDIATSSNAEVDPYYYILGEILVYSNDDVEIEE